MPDICADAFYNSERSPSVTTVKDAVALNRPDPIAFFAGAMPTTRLGSICAESEIFQVATSSWIG